LIVCSPLELVDELSFLDHLHMLEVLFVYLRRGGYFLRTVAE
jgi:hypothetical protein